MDENPLSRFTTDELIAEIKNRTSFIQTEEDDDPCGCEYLYIMKTGNPRVSDEELEGTLEDILRNISRSYDLKVFAENAPGLGLGEVFSSREDDCYDDDYYMTTVITRTK